MRWGRLTTEAPSRTCRRVHAAPSRHPGASSPTAAAMDTECAYRMHTTNAAGCLPACSTWWLCARQHATRQLGEIDGARNQRQRLGIRTLRYMVLRCVTNGRAAAFGVVESPRPWRGGEREGVSTVVWRRSVRHAPGSGARPNRGGEMPFCAGWCGVVLVGQTC